MSSLFFILSLYRSSTCEDIVILIRMELKHYSRDNCVTVWSNSKNHGELLACASANPDNTNLADLEILSVDLADPAKNLSVEGKSTYNVPYRCLAWGTFGEKEAKLPYGLIFGGMENGSFTLWNPAEMIEQNYIDDQNSFVYAEEAEQDGYPIICAQWNPLKNNYLAYGSTSLFMIDVGKELSPPELLKPSATNPHEGSYITSVAWNKSVSHILASAGSDGLIALYDIKSKKSIFNFRDNSSNNNTRQVEIAWSKQISTHIAVALDDDKKNQIQIWDLRSQKGPIVVLDKGHTKGVNTMDWSELDHDLILTASRDSRINCWSYKQDQEPLSTRKVDGEIVKIAWAKNLPSIYSVVTTEGVSICSLDDRNIHSYIPKWLKTPASTAFNGNQSFLTYSEDRGANLIEYSVKAHISKQISEGLAILEEFLDHDNVQNLKDGDGETGQFWRLISTKRNQQGDADIYEFLGLSKQKIIKEVQKYTGKKRESFATNDLKSSKKQKTKTSKLDYTPVPESEAAEIFGKMSFEPMDKSFTKNEQDFETENVKYDMVPRNFNWDIGKEKLIKQNLLIGNYEGAIDAALKCGRTAEALIIAYSIDQTTFNNTLKTFCTETTDRFISGILRHIAFKDTEELVNRYDLDKWKECVALIFSLSSADRRKALLSKLARRLSSESKDHEDAVISCYILAQEFDEIVEMYAAKLSKQKSYSRARKVLLIESTTRLMAIYSCLTVDIRISPNFDRLLRELALVCLEANKKLLSYKILTKYAPNSTKIINYLIQNTNDLSSYRNQGSVIVSLPVMNKRQDKPVAKKGNKNVQYQQEVPTNIKPNRQPKLPKNNAFDDREADDTKAAKGRGPVPPPPPPIQPVPVAKPNVVQPNKSTVAPPPPPPSYSKKGQPFEAEVQQQKESRPEPPSHNAFPKKGSISPPPPPPAPKNFAKTNNPQYEEEPSHQRRPMPAKQNFEPHHQGGRVPPPPPPPSHQVHQNVRQEQPNTINRPVPPTLSKNIPPPPPPSRHAAQKQEEEEEPPRKEIAQRINKLPPRVQQQQQQPPPPMMKQLQRREQEQEDEDESEEQAAQQVQQKALTKPVSQQTAIRPPPPAPVKKTGSVPPPPGKSNRVVSQESQNDEQQQSNASFQAQSKRPPPPSTGNKRVPPPPPPRK